MHTIISPLMYNNEVYSSSGLRICTNAIYDGAKIAVDGRATTLTGYELVQLKECLGRL